MRLGKSLHPKIVSLRGYCEKKKIYFYSIRSQTETRITEIFKI